MVSVKCNWLVSIPIVVTFDEYDEKALESFKLMQLMGVIPNLTTFLHALGLRTRKISKFIGEWISLCQDGGNA